MLSSLSLAAIGVILLVLFGVFHWLGVLTKARSFMAFAGVCCVGLIGWVGHVLANIVTAGSHFGGTATSVLFGVGVPAVVFIVLAVVLVHDWHPKHGASKRTGWLAIIVAAILVAGVSGFSAANGIPNTVRSVVTNARTIGG